MKTTRREFIKNTLIFGGSLVFSPFPAHASLQKEEQWFPAYGELEKEGKLAERVEEAYAIFEDRFILKENIPMFERLFNKKYRFTWVALSVVAILAVGMLFPQVRAIGSSFLGLFRVEQFTIIQVDPEQIEGQLGSSSNFGYLLADFWYLQYHQDLL